MPVLELPAQRVANVAHQILDPPGAADVAAQLLDLVEPAELEAGAPSGLPRRQPGPDVVGHLPLDVVTQLGVELVLDPVTKPRPLQRLPPAHRASPSATSGFPAAGTSCAAAVSVHS